MSKWENTSLGQISADISYGYTEKADLKQIGPKFLRITDIAKGRLNWDNVPYCQITKDKLEKYRLGSGDIVIARTGATTGATYTIKPTDPKEVVYASYLIRFKIDKKLADPYFIDYVLRSSSWKGFVEGIKGGSAQPGANAKQFSSFEFLLPTLPEQRIISETLKCLDDKIDLLHRQNQTLEQMAEVLFRQWFVEEAEEGWERKPLYDAIILVGGGTPKTSVEGYWNGKIKWLSGGDISANHKSVIISSEKSITEVGLENSSAKLLPKFSTVISARGTVGKYCIISEPMVFSQSNYGIKPKYSDCYFFTYSLINHCVKELNSAAYGSVFDTITTKTFKNLILPIPSESEIILFEEKIKNYFIRILNNQLQIKTLSNLRDNLLPKLMSGSIRIT